MFRHILIPQDGSETSQRVLGPLRHLLGGDEVARVTLLRVLSPGEDEPAARVDQERLVGLLSAGGVPARQELAQGDAAEEILRAAEALDVDLVAMGTHGRGGLTRLLRGSVAERVLRRCARPLLLCNPQVLHASGPHEGFRRILVAWDGSPLAERIVPHAVALARAYGAEVVLLEVENFATRAQHPRLREPAEVLAGLAPVAARLRAAGVSEVRCRAATGSEAGELLRAVEELEVDLLAMTTHGRTGSDRWWFGSVAEALVRAAPCPLYVLRVAAGA